MHYNNGKGHISKLRSNKNLFNQSYKVQIPPLVIYGLGVDTYPHENDFKKSGGRWPVAGVCLV